MPTGFVLSPEDRSVIQRVVDEVLAGKGYSQKPKARRRRFRATGESPTGEAYGLLIADVAAASVTYSATQSEVAPGYAADAVIPLTKGSVTDTGTTQGNSTFKGELDDEDNQKLLAVVNPIWPETIYAGAGTEEDTPVVVRGYVDPEWSRADGEGGTEDATAFVITNVVYPVTILRGLTDGAVATTDSTFDADNLTLLWGRDPGVSSLTGVTNVLTSTGDYWDAPDNAYVLIMQITNGTYRAIDMECST